MDTGRGARNHTRRKLAERTFGARRPTLRAGGVRPLHRPPVCLLQRVQARDCLAAERIGRQSVGARDLDREVGSARRAGDTSGTS